MAFDPNIPQPADLLSVSQNDILINFQQLNVVYGTDHFAYDDGTPDARKHRRIMLPDTTAAPPAPAANNGAMYSRTATNQTYPYWRRDGVVIDWPMVPVKAFAEFTVPGVAITAGSVNVAGVVRTAAGVYTITFTQPLIDANYLVLLSAVVANPPTGGPGFFSYRNKAANTFQIIIQRLDGTALIDDNITSISFSVIRA